MQNEVQTQFDPDGLDYFAHRAQLYVMYAGRPAQISLSEVLNEAKRLQIIHDDDVEFDGEEWARDISCPLQCAPKVVYGPIFDYWQALTSVEAATVIFSLLGSGEFWID